MTSRPDACEREPREAELERNHRVDPLGFYWVDVELVTGSLGIGAAWSDRKAQGDYQPMAWDNGSLVMQVQTLITASVTSSSASIDGYALSV